MNFGIMIYKKAVLFYNNTITDFDKNGTLCDVVRLEYRY